jgi:hypothetical protein
MNKYPSPVIKHLLARVASSAAAVLLLSVAAHAATTTVGCPGGTPGAHTSIMAALITLDNEGPHTVTVTGTCTESVNVMTRNRLTIEAPVGQLATIVAPAPNIVAIRVFGSQNIMLRRLVARDGGTGILVTNGSSVNMQAVQALDNTGQGIRIDQNSLATLTGTVTPAQPVVVSGNGSGINVDGSVFNFAGPSLVENNAGVGLSVVGGRLSASGVLADNVIRNNGGGVNLDGTIANFNGQFTIQNNSAVGIGISSSRVGFSAAEFPAGTPRVTVIEGHTVLGINIAASGSVNFGGPNIIRNNGSADPDDPQFNGGVRVGTVSRIQFNGGEITGNSGHGLYSDFNGAISVAGVTLSNNTGDAVRVARSSVGGFEPGNTFAGNGGANVSCDDTSLVFGELAGVAGIQCKNVERAKGKPRPGVIKAN